MPFFNGIAEACRAAESVLAQTYQNLQIIAIDDASTENPASLRALLGSRPDASVIRLPQNLGPAGARNAGLEAARGEFIAFLDADDTWETRKLERQVGRMLTNGWHFSHTSYVRHDLTTGAVRTVRSGHHSYRFPWPAFRCLIATPTVVCSRAILGELRFRSELRFAEDTFLWLALSQRTILHGIDAPLAHVFVDGDAAATNPAIQSAALSRLGREGLADRPALRLAHAGYRMMRQVQRRVWRLTGAQR